MASDMFNVQHSQVVGIARAGEGVITIRGNVMPVKGITIQYQQKVQLELLGNSYIFVTASRPMGAMKVQTMLGSDARTLVKDYGRLSSLASGNSLTVHLTTGGQVEMPDGADMELSTETTVVLRNLLVESDTIQNTSQKPAIINDIQVMALDIDEPIVPDPTPIPTPTPVPTPT